MTHVIIQVIGLGYCDATVMVINVIVVPQFVSEDYPGYYDAANYGEAGYRDQLYSRDDDYHV